MGGKAASVSPQQRPRSPGAEHPHHGGRSLSHTPAEPQLDVSNKTLTPPKGTGAHERFLSGSTMQGLVHISKYGYEAAEETKYSKIYGDAGFSMASRGSGRHMDRGLRAWCRQTFVLKHSGNSGERSRTISLLKTRQVPKQFPGSSLHSYRVSSTGFAGALTKSLLVTQKSHTTISVCHQPSAKAEYGKPQLRFLLGFSPPSPPKKSSGKEQWDGSAGQALEAAAPRHLLCGTSLGLNPLPTPANRSIPHLICLRMTENARQRGVYKIINWITSVE